jgi:hypothetical protein
MGPSYASSQRRLRVRIAECLPFDELRLRRSNAKA